MSPHQVDASALVLNLISWLEARASPTVKDVLGEIREHFLEEGYTVTKLKRTLGLNDNFVIAAFSAEVFGFTIRGFIRQCRLLTAACLLRDTSRSLAEITLDVGYNDDESNFSNQFHEWCGLYPTAYRDLARELSRHSGHGPEEVFTWGGWRRLYQSELDIAEARVMIRYLETLASAVVAVSCQKFLSQKS